MASPVGEVLHADRALAARLEGLCASEMRRFARTALGLDPESGAGWIDVGGGVASFVGAGSPVNSAVGLGMAGPVSDGDIAAVERYFAERATRPTIAVCPLAHPTLTEVLARRGWVPDGFEHVLVRRLSAGEEFAPAPDGIEIRLAQTDEDKALWGLVAATGFSFPHAPLEAQVALGAVVVARPGSRLFLAWLDGKAAGTGELYVEDGVAWLSADTTLPQFRGRGVQQALQRHRLAMGATQGCDIAATETQPGSGSQRNMERAGFRVAYTRAELVFGEEITPAERTAE